jgi:hypothetical protein
MRDNTSNFHVESDGLQSQPEQGLTWGRILSIFQYFEASTGTGTGPQNLVRASSFQNVIYYPSQYKLS